MFVGGALQGLQFGVEARIPVLFEPWVTVQLQGQLQPLTHALGQAKAALETMLLLTVIEQELHILKLPRLFAGQILPQNTAVADGQAWHLQQPLHQGAVAASLLLTG